MSKFKQSQVAKLAAMIKEKDVDAAELPANLPAFLKEIGAARAPSKAQLKLLTIMLVESQRLMRPGGRLPADILANIVVSTIEPAEAELPGIDSNWSSGSNADSPACQMSFMAYNEYTRLAQNALKAYYECLDVPGFGGGDDGDITSEIGQAQSDEGEPDDQTGDIEIPCQDQLRTFEDIMFRLNQIIDEMLALGCITED